MKSNTRLNILIVILIILSGKAISFARSLLMSYYFGATSVTDAYFVAFNTPSIIYSALISSYLLLLVPQYDKIWTRSGVWEANNFLSKFITFITLISLVMSVIFFIFIGNLIGILAPEFNETSKNLAIDLGVILIISFPFTAISQSLAVISTVHNKFYAQHIIPIFSGIFVISCLFFFVKQYGIFVLAISALVANMIQVPIQIYIARGYFSYSVENKILLDRNIRAISLLVFPVFFSNSIEQLNSIVNTILSSKAAEGSLSALNYAQTIQLTLLGVFTTAIITVMYPRMSKLSSLNKTEELISVTWKSIKYLILLITPVIVYFTLNVGSLVSIIFTRGAFTDFAASQTSSILLFLLLNIFFISIREFIIRYYYVSGRTLPPMYSGIISVTINIILSFILVNKYGVSGLSLANLLATVIGVIFLLSFPDIRKKFSPLNKDIKVFFFKLFSAVAVVIIFHKSIIIFFDTTEFSIFLFFFILYTCLFYILLLLFRQKEITESVLQLIKLLRHHVYK